MNATRTAAMLAVGLAAITSCGGSLLSGSETQQASIGGFGFEVPADWRRTETTLGGPATSIWTPDPASNDRKESVTVIRGEVPHARGTPTTEILEQLLAGSQASLRAARMTPVARVTTEQGLVGARVDVTFVPGVGTARYRRIHVVLAEPGGTALMHVLYTAAHPDGDLSAFHLVLDSIRKQGGS